MALTAGIIGLPNVGKSTLFKAITKQNILVANYPFATITPNLGVVIVPDTRLEALKEIYDPKTVIPTTFEFTDIAGLVKGAAKGEGLGNKFLGHIGEVDAICHVVRCFEDESISHVENNIDPLRDIEIINIELTLADLEVITNRLAKIGSKIITTADKAAIFEFTTLQKTKEALEKNIPLHQFEYNEAEHKILSSFNLLTLKPVIYVANILENELTLNSNPHLKRLQEYAYQNKTPVVVICAKIEAELNDLDDIDKKQYLKALKIEESGLDQLIKATYQLLELATFFTVESKILRAWTFKKGMTAKTCAGLIHTDFEKGFIKAEIISYLDIITYGSDKTVKEKGKLKIEGKDYLMQDGDICYFRFNC